MFYHFPFRLHITLQWKVQFLLTSVKTMRKVVYPIS